MHMIAGSTEAPCNAINKSRGIKFLNDVSILVSVIRRVDIFV